MYEWSANHKYLTVRLNYCNYAKSITVWMFTYQIKCWQHLSALKVPLFQGCVGFVWFKICNKFTHAIVCQFRPLELHLRTSKGNDFASSFVWHIVKHQDTSDTLHPWGTPYLGRLPGYWLTSIYPSTWKHGSLLVLQALHIAFWCYGQNALCT